MESATTRWGSIGRQRVGIDQAAPWLFGVALAIGAGLIVHLTRGTTFAADEWIWILERRAFSAHVFLAPHNGHFSLIPLIIYKLWFKLWGMRTYVPYRALIVVGQLVVSTLVFIYVRRRAGGLAALLGGCLILFFGPGWDDVLWPFQIAWMISVATGIGALLMLERGDRRGDIAACLLVGCTLASSGVGIAITAGIAVELLVRPDRRRRAWVIALPLVLFAIWWIGYQNTHSSLSAVLHVPSVVANFLSGTAAGMFGLAGTVPPATSGTILNFGPPLAIALVVAIGWRLRVTGAPSPRGLALIAIVLAFGALVGLSRVDLSKGYESRYLYVGAVFTVLLLAEVFARMPLRGWIAWVIAAVALAAIVSNVGTLRLGGAYFRDQAQQARADLAALQTARPIVRSNYVADQFPGWPLVLVRAGPYFAAAHALGSPAATPAQVASYPQSDRIRFDRELIGAERIALAPANGAAPVGGGRLRIDGYVGGSVRQIGSCVRFIPFTVGPLHFVWVTVPPGGLRIGSRAVPASIAVRRLATVFTPIGTVSGAGELHPRHDTLSTPWVAQISATGPSETCGLG